MALRARGGSFGAGPRKRPLVRREESAEQRTRGIGYRGAVSDFNTSTSRGGGASKEGPCSLPPPPAKTKSPAWVTLRGLGGHYKEGAGVDRRGQSGLPGSAEEARDPGPERRIVAGDRGRGPLDPDSLPTSACAKQESRTDERRLILGPGNRRGRVGTGKARWSDQTPHETGISSAPPAQGKGIPCNDSPSP